ncbi:Mitochondrial distribution and morphology protein 35 [Exophiala xenobiotica]|nr:Mitochondrial distribution and morphology protein 35 [Exophiala xenobiotica]KAK5537081.1 Mitochondrial distribution and morphology protein 35 [Chaetothyriales sp. CCFEE 6169]KAK5203910.1 Mitochondrial distribution and morphology protein 35 [Exophiala xenobiotica]KAK5216543.1 Mitochondrial distribution and morphology protein 35 [Exophiala xenobiotica]KAK5226646.1 Mitochondrial distribution and morphology protein 35 [Exophiala xenobiotica]
MFLRAGHKSKSEASLEFDFLWEAIFKNNVTFSISDNQTCRRRWLLSAMKSRTGKTDRSQSIFVDTHPPTNANHSSSNINLKVLKEKGIDTMLANARDDTVSETDAEHLKR